MPDITIQPRQFTITAKREVTRVVEVDSSTPAPSSSLQYWAIAPADGQTVFELPFAPALPHLSTLFLNGVKARHGVDYVINSTVLTWQGVAIASTDTFEGYF